MSIVAAAELSIWVPGGAHLRRVVSVPRGSLRLRCAWLRVAPRLPSPLRCAPWLARCRPTLANRTGKLDLRARHLHVSAAQQRVIGTRLRSDRRRQLSQRKAVTPDLANDR